MESARTRPSPICLREQGREPNLLRGSRQPTSTASGPTYTHIYIDINTEVSGIPNEINFSHATGTLTHAVTEMVNMHGATYINSTFLEIAEQPTCRTNGNEH
eukprot:4450601-Pyramimonas_sp.AAC.1